MKSTKKGTGKKRFWDEEGNGHRKPFARCDRFACPNRNSRRNTERFGSVHGIQYPSSDAVQKFSPIGTIAQGDGDWPVRPVTAGRFPHPVPRPGYNNLDFSIFKEFPLGESKRKGENRRAVEFRGEFFNVLNHPNFGNPGSLDFTQDPNSPNFNFARITSGRGGSRVVQLALKLYW